MSAPSQETLDQYDGDLLKGQWYVDCSVGGSKYGQGMYTAYAPERHIIDYDSVYIKRSDSEFPDEVIRDKSGRLWQYDPKHEYTDISKVPAGYAIFCSEDIGDRNEVFIVKEPGKTLTDSSGEEYEFSVLWGMYGKKVMKSITEEEAKTPDYSRPLGQMRDYIELNESREKRFNPAKDAYRDKIKWLEERCVSIYGHFNPGEVWGVNGLPEYVNIIGENSDLYYKVNPESKPINQNGYDKLKPGKYLITYDDRMERGKRNMFPVEVDENGEKVRVDTWSTLEPDVEWGRIKNSNPEIHECTDVTPEEPPEVTPKTVTRKMTLDPATKYVRYEDLEREFYEYKYDCEKRKYKRFVSDIGAFAALRGYDAIACNNYGKTIVVLNRSKLILSDEKVEVPREEAS